MSFDNSRFSFDPTRDYFGVIMQQGRAQLDSDWNEWLAQLSRRLHAGTLDLVGKSGVPATTPSGFKINAFIDPATLIPHLTIGAGRIYVDGLLAENHGPATSSPQWDPALGEFSAAPQLPNIAEVDLDYTQQPYLSGLTLTAAQVSGKQFLVYLDVWQRDVSALQDSSLIEPAVGIDTTGRRQTVWQVKLLDITGLGFTAATPDAPIPGRLTSDPAIQSWASLIQPSGGLLTTGVGGVQTTVSSACALSPVSGYTGLENQLYRVQIHQAATATTPATFKWSRENASVSTLVTAITTLATNGASQLTVQSLGRDDVLGFHPGDWIEITSDALELNGQSGELHLITGIESHGRTITLATAVTTNFPLAATPATPTTPAIPNPYTRILRWDQAGLVYLSDGTSTIANLDATGAVGIPVPPPGTTLLLESGITVAFDLAASGGSFLPGDFWTFAARTADSSVQPLNLAAPQGPHHHFARLATVDFAAQFNGVVDARRPIPSLANPALHVTSVLSGGTTLLNDNTITIQTLVNNGLSVICDAPLDPAAITHPNLVVAGAAAGTVPTTQPNCPVCFVTLDLPSAANGGAFTRVTLPSVVSIGPPSAAPNTLLWKHALPPAALTLIESQVPLAGPPVLARLTLKGNAIWAAANPGVFLNGAANGRPSADYELWFWLISQPVATLSAATLQFNPQVATTPSPVQTITLFNNSTTAPLAIKNIAILPANVGFTQTNTCGASIPAATSTATPASGTISVTFNPPTSGPASATLSITEGADANPLTVALQGTGIQPSLISSVAALSFPTNTVIGTTSAAQPVTLTSNGTSAVTVSSIVVAPGAAFVSSQFVLINLPAMPFTMQPGDTLQFQAAYRPTMAGSGSVPIVVTHSAPGSPLVINLSGSAVAGAPVISPSLTTLSFGQTAINTGRSTPLTITNTGNAVLTISSIAKTGAQAANFTFTSGSSSLQPGQATTVTVVFTPTGIGASAAQLQIVHNAAGSPLLINLTGTGFAPKNVIAETKVIRDNPVKNAVTRLATESFLPVASLGNPGVLHAQLQPAAVPQTAFITPEERPALTPHVIAPEPATPEPPSEEAPPAPKPE